MRTHESAGRVCFNSFHLDSSSDPRYAPATSPFPLSPSLGRPVRACRRLAAGEGDALACGRAVADARRQAQRRPRLRLDLPLHGAAHGLGHHT
eukprot:1087246-Pleurochrysis_carterae.AAC.1